MGGQVIVGYSWRVPLTEQPDAAVADLRSRVLVAARTEVVNRGILGMRVANVAALAGCSITSMYRCFGSRDGLLAEVLLGLYEESFEALYAVVREKLGGIGPITIDDIVASIPLPHYDTSRRDHSLRSQVLAVAGTNPILRSRLAESLRTRRLMLNTLLDDVQSRLPAETPLNRDVITVLIFNLNWQYNDLMGDWAVSNEEYTSLLRHLLVNRRNK
jgi:AcrR family transcriptional regulator